MIGWHWTSERNWLNIQRDRCMREYVLDKPGVADVIGTPAGIFVFPEGPIDDFDEAGCVWFQAVGKKSFRVVLLNISYEAQDVRGPIHPLDTLRLGHNGSLGADDHWPYHLDKEMLVLRGPILLPRIELVRVYDITDVVSCARESNWGRVAI